MDTYIHNNNNNNNKNKNYNKRVGPLGSWSVDFGSGHGLTVGGNEPHVKLYTESMEAAWDSLSPSLSAPPPLVHTFSLHLKISK